MDGMSGELSNLLRFVLLVIVAAVAGVVPFTITLWAVGRPSRGMRHEDDAPVTFGTVDEATPDEESAVATTIPETLGPAGQRFQELREELERLVGDDPRLMVCPADPERDGAEFAGGVVLRPREASFNGYAEMRIAPCVAEVFLRPEGSPFRSVLALEEGYCMDTCDMGSAEDLARILVGTLENHLDWLDRAHDPAA